MASVATLARPYQDYAFDYGSQGLPQQPADQVAVTAAEYGQLIAAQSFQQQQHQQPSHYIHSPEQTTQAYQQHGMAAVLPSQMSAPEAAYGVEQAHMMPVSRRVSYAAPVYGSPHENMQPQIAYQQQQQQQQQSQQSSARKRSHAEFSHDYQEMHQMHNPSVSSQVPVEMTPHGPHSQMSAQAYGYSPDLSPTHSPSGHNMAHHHHRLPNQPPPSKFHRTGYGEDLYAADEHGPPSVVGQPGMPEPAAKPKGPKLKFTSEDDALLRELKETKALTWKQIADFFPGRSSGTLQVRYCTKLKAKEMHWTEDMTDRLRQALEEYEHDRWRIVSSKVGNGFSASACKEKNDELNGIPPERRSPIVGDDNLDSLPVSAIDDDGSQSFVDKYENSLSVHSVHSQSYESALPPPPPSQEHHQQAYESSLPPGPPAMSEHHRLSEHQHPYESALPPHHQMSDHRLSEAV